jgi:acetyl-CoA acyltransferase
MPRTLQEVVFVDGVRTPFGKAGDKGIYAQTRADDLVIKCIRELLRRTPNCPRNGSRRSRSPPPPRSATRA